jgi:hypothetical protein
MTMATKSESPEDEVTRLRARVQELESELESSKRKPKGADPKGRTREISDKLGDEAARLIRGIALAGVEQVRITASVLNSFADTVSQRNRPKAKESHSDLAKDLPNDLYSGILNAIEQSLEMPGKVVNRLHETYAETK